MKHVLRIVLVLLIGTLVFAQTTDWQILQGPTEPLIYTNDNLFFLNNNEGWIVGGDALILHTTDGGQTWTVQSYNEVTDTTFNDVYFLDSNTGWVVGNDGIIWKTTDGGATWVDQTLTTNTLDIVSVHAVDANVVYACGDDGLIMKTTDGGTTWVVQYTSGSSTPDLVEIYAWDADHAFAVSTSDDGVIMVTGDGGATWETKQAPFPAGLVSSRQYGCAGAPGGVGYSCAYHGVVFKTTDYGQTWSVVGHFFGSLFKILYEIGAADANTVYTADGDSRMFKSTDGGATWDTLHIPSANNVRYIRPFDVNNVVLFTSYGQLFETSDGGQTWTPKMGWPNLSFYAMGKASSTKIFAGAIFGGDLTMSNDGGMSWSYPTTTLSNAVDGILDIFFVDENLGFFSGQNAQIGKTTDGGMTWELKPNSQFFEGSTKSYYFINFKNANEGVVGGSSGILQFTTDGGETWTEGSVGTTATLYDLEWIDANTAVIAASSGRIYKTTDGGSTWTEVVDLGTQTLRDVEFIDANTGFITGSDATLYKTTDGGNTWTAHYTFSNANAPGDSPILYKVQFLNTTTGYVCGEDGAIYKTTDGGDSWTQMTVPDEVKTYYMQAMVWLSETAGIMVGQNGYILGHGITGIRSDAPVASTYQLFQNYPNPFNPTTTISFNLPKTSRVELTIYNSLGQMVKKLYQGTLPAGYHEIQWDGRNQFGLNSPSGVYFYRLVAQDFQAVKKMMLLR